LAYLIIFLDGWPRSGVGLLLGIRSAVRDRMLENGLENVVRRGVIEKHIH
jgi:hypothetical protein